MGHAARIAYGRGRRRPAGRLPRQPSPGRASPRTSDTDLVIVCHLTQIGPTSHGDRDLAQPLHQADGVAGVVTTTSAVSSRFNSSG